MKARKIISLVVAMMLIFSLATALSACGEDNPIIDEPTKDEPTEEEPTVEDPTEEPTTEEPTTEEPTVEEPTTEDPTTDEPEVPEETPENPEDTPTTEEPTVEEPTKDEPTAEEPEENPEDSPSNTDEPTEEDPTEDSPSAADIILVENGVTSFKIVVANGISAELNMTVGKLVDELKKLGVNTEVVFDNKDTATDCEVLIGEVKSRGEKYCLDPHAYGWKGYTVQAIDGKIIILGGSDESLLDAIDAFKKDILGITKKTKTITDAKMTADQTIKVVQDDYALKSVTVSGSSLKDYVIVTSSDERSELTAAKSVQELIYKKSGWWLNIVAPEEQYEKAISISLTTAKTCKSDKGFILEIKDGNILIDCGFASKIEEACLAFFMTEITNSGKADVSFADNYKYEKIDYKNIYYSDFGAKGDGYSDDFEEILAAHEYANEYGHTVNADKGAHYYIGTEYQKTKKVIPIKTDVNWTGAKFTLDDSNVTVLRQEHSNLDGDSLCDKCGRELDDVCKASSKSLHELSIFNVQSDYETYVITDYFEGKSVKKSDTNVGFAPGSAVLIKIQNSNVRHFIRYGVNENAGNVQSEMILVDKDGNIDPSTPLHWSYDVVTKAYMKCVEDEPITIQGGDFVNIANQSENYYDSYGRNIYIERSNVTVKNITHALEGTGETRAPYVGFFNTEFVNNIEFDNITVDHHEDRYDKKSGALLGTYEIGVRYANDVRYLNVKQIDFFEEDGTVAHKGVFGSNYCKNFYFDGCYMTSMDAHCGLYNCTIKNSTFEHMNFIGEGLILIENVTVYADVAGGAIKLRDDYGSTWNGEVIIDGFDIRITKSAYKAVDLFRVKYTDWWFGFETYLPHTVKINNLTVTEYSQTTDATGKRTETSLSTNLVSLNIVSSSLGKYTDKDISKLASDGSGAKYNAYQGIKHLEVTNCENLIITIPDTPQFKYLEYYRNGELVAR